METALSIVRPQAQQVGDRVIDDVEHAEQDRETESGAAGTTTGERSPLCCTASEVPRCISGGSFVHLLQRLHLRLHADVRDDALLLPDTQRNQQDFNKYGKDNQRNSVIVGQLIDSIHNPPQWNADNGK
jgi:hypothetical protein